MKTITKLLSLLLKSLFTMTSLNKTNSDLSYYFPAFNYNKKNVIKTKYYSHQTFSVMNQKFRSSIFLTCQLIFVLLTTTISNTSIPFEPLWIQFLCCLITNTNTCRCTTTTHVVLLSMTKI